MRDHAKKSAGKSHMTMSAFAKTELQCVCSVKQNFGDYNANLWFRSLVLDESITDNWPPNLELLRNRCSYM